MSCVTSEPLQKEVLSSEKFLPKFYCLNVFLIRVLVLVLHYIDEYSGCMINRFICNIVVYLPKWLSTERHE